MPHPFHTILVTGGRGMLGRDLVTLLTAQGFAVTVADLPDCDLRDAALLARLVSTADAIINCAAYTQVDKAEQDQELAVAVNARMPAKLATLAAQRGAYLLHISTDFVFDGSGDQPYAESATPAPLSVYGSSKLAGETAVAASGCEHAIVRIEWTYGAGSANFVRKVLDRARQPGDMKMVADQVGAPTWTRDVAAALLALLHSRGTGLFHYAAQGYASRFEVAEFILREAGVRRPLLPCRTADFPAPARRPLNSRFNCARFDSCCPGLRRPWQAALREYLAALPGGG